VGSLSLFGLARDKMVQVMEFMDDCLRAHLF
jgi:hypothetical protein